MQDGLPFEFYLVFLDVFFLDAQELEVFIELLEFVVEVLLVGLLYFSFSCQLWYLNLHHLYLNIF